MPRSKGTCVHTPTLIQSYVISQDVSDIPGKGVRLKCWSYHRNEPGVSFPFNTKLLLTFLNLSRKSWYLWQEDRRARRDIPRAIRQSARMLGRALLLLFKSDTHQDNSLSRPCLLCRKPHSKHGLVCGREAAYRPTLFMLQVGLTEKPHQFVLK